VDEQDDESLEGAEGGNGDMKAVSKLRLFITYEPKYFKLKFIIGKLVNNKF
jgi:hypothetical protein